MGELVWLLVFLLTASVAAYKRMTLSNTVSLLAGVMVLGTLFGSIGFFSWLVFLIVAVPLSIPDIRRPYITKPILAFYKKVSPEMSATEQEAIDAGTVWWDGELFSGKPNWDKLHAIPKGRLIPEERAFLDGPVDRVCHMVNEWQINHQNADLSPEIWAYLKEHKFFAMIIKKKYGGLEFSAFAQSRVIQKLAGCSAVLSSTVGVPNSLGPGELLQHYGTPEQQDHYLPRLDRKSVV